MHDGVVEYNLLSCAVLLSCSWASCCRTYCDTYAHWIKIILHKVSALCCFSCSEVDTQERCIDRIKYYVKL